MNIEQSKQFLERAIKHFQDALQKVPDLVGENFKNAIDLIDVTKGHIICCGMGKSGLIAQKMAATFSSTGIPSFFMHPSEALHGDLGVITPDDALLLISNSGETKELLAILPSLEKFGNKSIAFTGRLESTLDKFADITLPITVSRELCPNDLAPTTSTMITLAIGDLLAVALMEVKGFGGRDFARLHPGGSLGRKLLMQVRDTMRTEDLPMVSPGTLVQDAIIKMTQGRLGLVLILDQQKILKGVLTDGDLRRALQSDNDILQQSCEKYMSVTPITINEKTNLAEADEIMLNNGVKSLIVADDNQCVKGIVEIYSNE